MCLSVRAYLLSLLSLLVVCAACGQSSRPGLPSDSPFADTEQSSMKLLSYGMAVGDVSDHSAVIWVKTNGAAKVTLEHWPATPRRESNAPQKGEESQVRRSSLETIVDHDYTLHVLLRDLLPATRYEIRIQAQSEQTDPAQDTLSPAPKTIAEELHGEFRTLVAPAAHETVTLGWSADIGGQAQCRHGGPGYPIFDVARMEALDFFLLLGDTVYADEICPVPPNAPGSEFRAVTLEEYRAKHRYQRGSTAFQRFLASVPVYVVWDDHEVRNNFAGPFDPQMPIGRQALFDYWPIGTSADDPHRLYRRLRAGADLEVFILDTRQYRSRNSSPDGPMKTMLGEAQLKWLLEGLEDSSATWKIIASSVPLSVPKAGPPHEPGNDGWAGAPDGTGFETELKTIAERIVSRRIRNVVWLTADVHFVQATAYDADRDGAPDFHEFVAGPLSAASKRMVAARSPFAVRTLVSEGGYLNFGKVRVDKTSFEVTIIDDVGKTRFRHRVAAR